MPPTLPLALALVASGVIEFAVCTLADGVDTHRHLFLFQAVTDLLLLLEVALPVAAISSRVMDQTKINSHRNRFPLP